MANKEKIRQFVEAKLKDQRSKKPSTEDKRHTDKKKKVREIGPRGGKKEISGAGKTHYVKKALNEEYVKQLVEEIIKESENE